MGDAQYFVAPSSVDGGAATSYYTLLNSLCGLNFFCPSWKESGSARPFWFLVPFLAHDDDWMLMQIVCLSSLVRQITAQKYTYSARYLLWLELMRRDAMAASRRA